MSHFKAYSAHPGGVSTKTPAVVLGESDTLGAVAVDTAAFARFESELEAKLDELVRRWSSWTTPDGRYCEIRKIVKQRGAK